MSKRTDQKIRAIWEFEYDPGSLQYPNEVKALAERAQVDMECGQFERFIEKGHGRFRFEIVENPVSRETEHSISVGRTWARH